MNDYTVTISLTMAIPANDTQQAQERGDMVADALTLKAPTKKPSWWPEPDLTIEVEEG